MAEVVTNAAFINLTNQILEEFNNPETIEALKNALNGDKKAALKFRKKSIELGKMFKFYRAKSIEIGL